MSQLFFATAADVLTFLLNHPAQAASNRGLNLEMIWMGVKDRSGTIGYGIGFAEGVWQPVGWLCGGVVEPSRVGGESVSINGFLELMLLTCVPIVEFSGVKSLVIALPIEANSDLQEAQKLLHAAWSQVPKLDHGRSSFHLCSDSQTQAGWHAVHVEDVAPEFDYTTFLQSNRALFREQGLKILAPAWDRGGCFLYVEFGFRYSVPEAFQKLYRGKHGQLVLCLGSREVPLPSGGGRWWEPAWHVMDGANYYSLGRLIEIGRDAQPKTTIYRANTLDDPGLTVLTQTMGIGRTADAIAATQSLEIQIGTLQSELEKLNAKRDRLRQREQKDYLAVYRWYQPVGEGLPRGLESLLSNPLGHLERYLYAQHPSSDGGWIHLVATQDRQGAGAALAVLCDQIFLCESRWFEWNLPLFVRHDCALSLDISEEEMAAKVRDVLPIADASDGIEGEWWFLVEPAPGTDKRTVPGLAGLHFTSVRFLTSLDKSLRLTNTRAEGSRVAAKIAGLEAEGAVVTHQVLASETALELDKELNQRAGSQLAQIESAWEEVRVRLHQVAFNTQLAEIATKSLRASYQRLPEAWSTFVERVLQTDEKIFRCKLEALGKWRTAEPARQTLLEQHQAGLAEVAPLIVERQQRYKEVLPSIQAKSAEIGKELQELAQLAGRLAEAQTELTERANQVATKNDDVQKKSNELAAAIKAAKEKIEVNAKLIAEVTELESEYAKLLARSSLQVDELIQAQPELHALINKAEELSRTMGREARPAAKGDDAAKSSATGRADSFPAVQPERHVSVNKPAGPGNASREAQPGSRSGRAKRPPGWWNRWFGRWINR